MGLGFIGWKTLPNKSSAAGRQAGRKSTGEEDGKKKRTRNFAELGEEDGAGRKQQFQTGEFTPYSDRR
jgi:hypothetical protein